MKNLKFIVKGKPAPKGSWSPITVRGRTRLVPSNKNSKPYEQKVEKECIMAIAEAGGIKQEVFDTYACIVNVLFEFPRPKSHFGTGKNASKLKESAAVHHTVMPDKDKLTRNILDAMQGVAYKNDSQVFDGKTTKIYAEGQPDHEGIAYVEVIYKTNKQ